MARKTFEFCSEAEAKAFVQGVEYVNDSAVEVKGIKQRKKTGHWIVTVADSDAHEEG